MPDHTPTRRRPLGFGWNRGLIIWANPDPAGELLQTGPGWIRIRHHGRWVEYRSDDTDSGALLAPTREVFEIVHT